MLLSLWSPISGIIFPPIGLMSPALYSGNSWPIRSYKYNIFRIQPTHQILQIQYIRETADPSDPYKYNIFGIQPTHQILTNTVYSGYSQPIISLQIQYIGDTADPSDPYKYSIFRIQPNHQILTNTIYSGYSRPIRSFQIQYIRDTADPSDPYNYNIFGIQPTHQILTNTIYSGYSQSIAVSFFACKPVFQFYNVCFLNDTPSMERYGDATFTTVT